MKDQMKSSTEPFPLYCVTLSHQHILSKSFSQQSRTLSIHGPSTSAPVQSSNLTMPGGNVMFNNLHGCTINVTQAPPPPQPPLMPNIELTEKELDELFSHVSA